MLVGYATLQTFLHSHNCSARSFVQLQATETALNPLEMPEKWHFSNVSVYREDDATEYGLLPRSVYGHSISMSKPRVSPVYVRT